MAQRPPARLIALLAGMSAALLLAASIGTALGGGGSIPIGQRTFQPVAAEATASVPAVIVGPAGYTSEAAETRADAGPPLPLLLEALAGELSGNRCPADRVPSTTPPPAPARTATNPVAAFLGDSYTTGYNGFGQGVSGWAAIVSAALGLSPFNRAVAGTGFVNPGWTAQPIGTRVGDVIGAAPRVVFVAGGHNDRSYGAPAALSAASPVIERLVAALPGSILVLIGPIWPDGSAPASLVALDDGLRAKADQVGAVFIDPIRDGWFAGAAHALISGDGIHPTDGGHRHIADLVLAALGADPGFDARLNPPAPPPTRGGSRPAAAPCPG